eukprot:PhF_6_TR44272/c0_g1_i1/m.68211
MNNVFPILLFRSRFVVVVVFLFLIGFFSYSASKIKATSSTPIIFPGGSLVNKYKDTQAQFGISGSCDYCSAYYQPRGVFPPLSITAVNACKDKYGFQMFAEVDACGVCFGDDACLDCANTYGGTAVYDKCGQCLEPSDSRFNQCMTCSYDRTLPECWYCSVVEGKMYRGGAGCNTVCNPDINCLKEHGVCNPWTGKCECHQNYNFGFFQNDPDTPDVYCTKCTDGFFPSGEENSVIPRCTRECTSITSSTLCGCVSSIGLCSNCGRFMVGPECSVQWSKQCDHGKVYNGACLCEDGWSGTTCNVYAECSNHGVIYDWTLVPTGGCKCIGQWRGVRCNYCRCFNGGVCGSDGTCTCPGAWTGIDCSICIASCRDHGKCPTPYTSSQYTEEYCPALFCESDLQNDVVCQQCQRGAICDQYNSIKNVTWRKGNCTSSIRCAVDNNNSCVAIGTFRVVKANVNNTNCLKCSGVWSGVSCEICGVQSLRGVTCAQNGQIIGCDGLVAKGTPKTLDNCGVCGGSGQCTGCDGIRGSNKVLDLCGVCGGYNDCAAVAGSRGVKPNAVVTMMFGAGDPSFDIGITALQNHLYQICTTLTGSNGYTQGEKSICSFADFPTWLNRNAASYGSSPNFPVARSNRVSIHILLALFAEQTGRVGEFGFSSANTTSPLQQLLWFKATFRTRLPVDSSRETVLAHYDSWRTLLNLYSSAIGGMTLKIHMTCDTWVSALTAEYALSGVAYSLIISIIIIVGIVFIISCSPTLTLLAMFSILGTVAMTLGTMQLRRWEITATEQIVISLLVGFASEYTMHIVEGYLEFLHATQSHIFAIKASRLEACRGMLLRTGAPIFSSSITAIIACLPLFGMTLTIFKTVGTILILVLAYSMLFALVFFVAMVACIGPTTSYRNNVLMLLAFVMYAALVAIGCLLLFLLGGTTGPDGSKIL